MSTIPTSVIAVEALIALVILGRAVGSYRGRSLVVSRLVVFPALVLLLYLSAEAETAYSIPWSFPLWTGIDFGVVAAAAVVTVPWARRVVSVYPGPNGGWMYRYGYELIAIYLGSWVVRLVLAIYYDPSSLEFTTAPGPALSAGASDVMQAVQLLFSMSTGLLLGRSVATYRLYREALANHPAVAPLP